MHAMKAEKPWIAFIVSCSVFCLCGFEGQATGQIQVVSSHYLTDWLLLGPYRSGTPEADSLNAFGSFFLQQPASGASVRTARGDTLRYRQQNHPGSPIVDLRAVYGPVQNASAIAYCRIESPDSTTAIFGIRHDDGAAVRVNGKLVYSHPGRRHLAIREATFAAPLRRGMNEIAVKVAQVDGQWGFALRLAPDSAAAGEATKVIVWPGGLQNAIPLMQNWRYHPGDSIEWAAVDFDDRSWEVTDSRLRPGQLPRTGWTGAGWFRLHLLVDTTLIGSPLTLHFTEHVGASELYLNGRLLYTIGVVGKGGAQERPAVPRLPLPLRFDAKREHVLAMRYSAFSAGKLADWQQPLGFGAYLLDAPQGMEFVFANIRRMTILQIIWTAMPLLFALQHILLFAFYPKSRQNLYFALFTVSIAIMAYFMVQVNFSDSVWQAVLYTRLLTTAVTIMSLTGLLCIYSFFTRLHIRRLVLPGFIGLALIIYYWIYPAFSPPAFLLAFVLLIFGEILRVIWHAIRKKRKSAWIIGAGFSIFILPLSYIMTRFLLGEGAIAATLNLFLIGILGLLIGMSIFLARDMATTQADNVRKTQELDEARRLQLSMLPQKLPELPSYAIAADMQTATEVGGDYYDFKFHSDGSLTLAIGDATGHGLQAGMMVAATKSLFNAMAESTDPAEILQKSTRALKQMGFQRMYMGLTVARFRDHHMEVAAAGMPFALIYRTGSGQVEELVIKAMPLGSFPNFPYRTRQLPLRAGDTVLFATDGLEEMFNPDGEIFGPDQVKQKLAAVGDQDPAEIIAELKRAARTWAGPRPQGDDLTLVVVKCK